MPSSEGPTVSRKTPVTRPEDSQTNNDDSQSSSQGAAVLTPYPWSLSRFREWQARSTAARHRWPGRNCAGPQPRRGLLGPQLRGGQKSGRRPCRFRPDSVQMSKDSWSYMEFCGSNGIVGIDDHFEGFGGDFGPPWKHHCLSRSY